MKTFVPGRHFKIGTSIWTFLGQPNNGQTKYQRWCFFNKAEMKRKCFTSEEMKDLDIIAL
tara:strand:- start:174 stop:353 length:180 start_codon:yes stop_codon:yes gene_type:complete